MEGTQLFCVCAEARRRLKALSLIPPASDLENFTRGKKKKEKICLGWKLGSGNSFGWRFALYTGRGEGICFAIAGAEKNTGIRYFGRMPRIFSMRERYTSRIIISSVVPVFHERIKGKICRVEWKLSFSEIASFGSRCIEVQTGVLFFRGIDRGSRNHRAAISNTRFLPPPLHWDDVELVKVSFKLIFNAWKQARRGALSEMVNFACSFPPR